MARRSPGRSSPGGAMPSRSRPPRPCATSDRKSTRLNSSHSQISYPVFCLKKKEAQGTDPERAVPLFSLLDQPASAPLIEHFSQRRSFVHLLAQRASSTQVWGRLARYVADSLQQEAVQLMQRAHKDRLQVIDLLHRCLYSTK